MLKLYSHKFKKYLIAYKEVGKKIEIYNSYNEQQYVENTIMNKIKIIEIIKEHREEILKKIKYYDEIQKEYMIILTCNIVILLSLGLILLCSFFVGDKIFFILSLVILSVYVLIFINYFYKIILFKKEIKILKNIKSNY